MQMLLKDMAILVDLVNILDYFSKTSTYFVAYFIIILTFYSFRVGYSYVL